MKFHASLLFVLLILFSCGTKKELGKVYTDVELEQLKLEGENWLVENLKNNPNILTTESGLQYEIIKEGRGKHPTSTDIVTVHYVGTHIDGKKFDSSIDRGEPTTFGLQQVIEGWTEGIPLMKRGGKMKFFIPEYLAYGIQGRPGIPPHTTLIFDVELISFKKNK